jgi:hypothetical protein
MIQRFTDIGGLNLRVSPFNHNGLLRAVNVTTDQIGAKVKRPGYTTHLSSLGTQVQTLFNWTRNNGTQFWNYCFAGGTLHYSTQGTGAWTVCGNGTFTGTHVGCAVLNDVLIAGDGVGSTRHSSDGTSFTNTTLAPASEQFEEYQGRIWAIGTGSDAFYSTTGTVSDWATDSTSILIPGAGKNNLIFKVADRLNFGKNSGLQFRWDGYSLVDLSTSLSYSSPYSMAEVEGYKIGLNRLGFYGNGGSKSECLSNPIQKQIFNNAGNAIVGSNFDSAPGVVYKYDYLCAVGTTSDDLTYGTVNNCIEKYNIQLNEWLNWQFANNPTAFLKYKDESGDEQLIWGDTTGQCYKLVGTALSDNGNPISTELMGFYDGGNLEEKKWDMVRMVFSPRSQAHVQLALTSALDFQNLTWIDLEPEKSGLLEYHFHGNSRSRFILYHVYESSMETRFALYAIEYHFDPILHE